MSLVIDASVAIAWSAPDESSPIADGSLGRVQAEGATVPSLWFLEVANILIMNERRNRLKQEEVLGIIEDLQSLNLQVDSETSSRSFGEIVSLARKHRLSTYDATYLELAVRLGLPLASLDRELVAAAEAEGVEVLKR